MVMTKDFSPETDKEYSEEFTKLVVTKMNELLSNGGKKNANNEGR